MAPSSRDRISVDFHGLKEALFERAQARGVSPSSRARTTLAKTLGQSDPININRSCTPLGGVTNGFENLNPGHPVVNSCTMISNW
jgi:hypothetical protein